MDQINEQSNITETRLIGAIDIGSNMIRMDIAQILPDGTIDTIEHLQRAVHLGQDTFVKGRLGRKTIRAAILILRDYKAKLDEYGAVTCRTVATSSIREALNAETFIDRVLISTGLEVQVIDSAEESRLTVSAVQNEVERDEQLLSEYTLITEVGGGSTVLTVMHENEIIASQSLGIGSIRLKEVLIDGHESHTQATEMIRNEINNVLSAIEKLIPFKKIVNFIAVGGDARFLAGQTKSNSSKFGLPSILRSQLDRFVKENITFTPDQLANRYNLSFADAESLNPAVMILQALVHATRAKEILVSKVSMRQGLMQSMSLELRGEEDKMLIQAATRSAMVVAEKYQLDTDHATKLAELSLELFDILKSEHGLSSRERLLLQVAALLHETGTFISGRAYHKHSYYIISNTEIFGLSQKDVSTIAHIARYHRRARPKITHEDYMNLSQSRRIVVNKLASVLRMATAFELKRNEFIADFRAHVQEDDLLITLPAQADSMLVQRQLRVKSDMFRDVYGLNVVVI